MPYVMTIDNGKILVKRLDMVHDAEALSIFNGPFYLRVNYKAMRFDQDKRSFGKCVNYFLQNHSHIFFEDDFRLAYL